MEATEVQGISPIETALAKENITNQVIEKLKADYSGLKINGIDDKAGFKAVEDARKHCKQLRVLAVNICKSGREDALKTQKDWIAKEKEIVAAIEVTENYLSAQSEAIKEEEKRILFEAAQKAKLPIRKERLMTIGVEVEDEKLLSINDADFDSLFNDLHSKVLSEQAEALRAEKQRIADEQEAERKRIEAEAKAEQEKVQAAEREKMRIENERLKAEKEATDKRNAIRNEQLRPYIIFIRDYNMMLTVSDDVYEKELSDIKIAAQQHYDFEAKEKLKRDAQIQKEIEEKEKIEKQLALERQAAQKAEAELRLAKEAEEKRLRDIEEADELELTKGDAAKITDLINDLNVLKTKYTFKSKKHQKLYSEIGQLLDKTINHAITKN